MSGVQFVQLVGQVVLAALLGSAAIAKARSFRAFIAYLATPFAAYAPAIAGCVIGVEAVIVGGLLLGVGLPAVAQLSLAGAVLFLLVVTAFLAYRLVLSDKTTCECWGGAGRRATDADEDVRLSAVRPMWYGLRNGALTAGTWMLLVTSTGRRFTLEELLAAFGVCPAILLVGAVVSIVVRRRALTLAEHPLKMVFAPQLRPLIALSWYMENGWATDGWQAVLRTCKPQS